MAPRWPKMAPRWFKMGPDGPDMPPSWPQMAPGRPKVAPRWAQDGTKIGLKIVKNLRKINVLALGVQSGPKQAQDDPKMVPRWPQEPKSSVFLGFLMVFGDARGCGHIPT